MISDQTSHVGKSPIKINKNTPSNTQKYLIQADIYYIFRCDISISLRDLNNKGGHSSRIKLASSNIVS